MAFRIQEVRMLQTPPNIIFTKPFIVRADPRLLYGFSRRLGSVLRYFPEIRGEIKVGLTNVYKGLASTESDGTTFHKKISFPSLKRAGIPTRYIMGHELMHIVQAKQSKTIPGTERACDVFTLARLPPRFIDQPPIYLSIPRKIRINWSNNHVRSLASSLMHDLAVEAIITRKTNPRYIRWWENQLVQLAEDGHPIAKSLKEV